MQNNSRLAANRLLKELSHKQTQKVARLQHNIDFLQFPNIQRTGKEISVKKYRELEGGGGGEGRKVEKGEREWTGQVESAEEQGIDRALHTYGLLGDKCRVFMDLLDKQAEQQLRHCVDTDDQAGFLQL